MLQCRGGNPAIHGTDGAALAFGISHDPTPEQTSVGIDAEQALTEPLPQIRVQPLGALLPADTEIAGPAIILEPTTTVVVYPGSTATVTPLGNYLLTIAPQTAEDAAETLRAEAPTT